MAHYGFCTVALDGAAVPAVSAEGAVVPLRELSTSAPDALRGLLPDWDRWCDVVEATLPTLPDRALPDPVFLPSVPDPSAIYCAGANYRDHLLEMGGSLADVAEAAPFHFLTAPAALTGHGTEVRRPPGCTHLDWEIELAVVVGRRAVEVSPEDALDHVAGYTVANDVSAREHVQHPHPALGIDWLRHKSYATLLPVGPAVVPRRLVPDPQDLSLRLTVDGVVRQDSSTKEMIFSVAEQLSALSHVAPLLPGDLVLTGTPAGTAAVHSRFLEPGERMIAEIPGVGRLENTVTQG